jgi:hypothetical protein
MSSPTIIKLGLDIEQIEDEYDKWQRERTTSSRIAFDEMLAENSFVDFWGRLGKIGGEGVNSSVKIESDDIGEGDGEEKVDMKELAKNVDIREMEKVLQVCSPSYMKPWVLSDICSLREIAGIACSIMYQNKENDG